MKKPLIYTILTILAAVIAYIILADVSSGELSNRENPYSYDLKEFKKVDASLIKYKEVKRIETNISKPKAIDYFNGLLGIAYEDNLQVIDTTGHEFFQTEIDATVTAISFNADGNIFLGCKDHVEIYNLNGELLDKWEINDTATYITSIAIKNDVIFLADAGKKQIHISTFEGEDLSSFKGSSRLERGNGFIIPSPYFDLAIDPDNQLWVANTGIQRIENYTDDGTLRSWWGEPSFTIDGFVGCCNPAQFSILSDGSFVTSEKGLTRIKVYDPSGTLESVVATPDDFNPGSEPADLAVDEMDAIYALDISGKMIRKFERKTNG